MAQQGYTPSALYATMLNLSQNCGNTTSLVLVQLSCYLRYAIAPHSTTMRSAVWGISPITTKGECFLTSPHLCIWRPERKEILPGIFLPIHAVPWIAPESDKPPCFWIGLHGSSYFSPCFEVKIGFILTWYPQQRH